jgi:hypothetical protein
VAMLETNIYLNTERLKMGKIMLEDDTMACSEGLSAEKETSSGFTCLWLSFFFFLACNRLGGFKSSRHESFKHNKDGLKKNNIQMYLFIDDRMLPKGLDFFKSCFFAFACYRIDLDGPLVS